MLVVPQLLCMKDYVVLGKKYFGEDRYTGEVEYCEEIYIPMHYGGNHWVCLKVDMIEGVALVFDTMRSQSSSLNLLGQAATTLTRFNELLNWHHPRKITDDVTEYPIAMMDAPPLQGPDDGYDCGMFVILFMQGRLFSNGHHKICSSMRSELVVSLIKDPANAVTTTVDEALAWKANMFNDQ